LNTPPIIERRVILSNQEQFYETLSAEYDAFIDRLKTQSPDEILIAAYEKVCKEEIVIVFENSSYSENEYAALLKIKNPLDTFYAEWLDADSADMEAIRDSVESAAERETGVKPGAEAEITYASYESAARRGSAGREKPNLTAEALNGEIKAGDWVISTTGEDYACLVGEVIEIVPLGSPEHDTGNFTDDIHVNFANDDYSEQRRHEIESDFGWLYTEPKSYDEIPLDDVIVAPGSLIRITELGRDEFGKLVESRANAETYCKETLAALANREPTLVARVEQNYADYKNSLLGFGKQELIDMAPSIHAYLDAWSYMTSYHAYSSDELEFYAQFKNPLEVVADAWQKQRIDFEDMSGTMDFVYMFRNTHLSAYPLISDKTEPEKPQEQLGSAPAKEKSPFDKALNRSKEKAEAYKAQKTGEPAADKKKHEERG
jgi:hypothetical protein